jgi:hypothetical protein
MMCVVKAWLCMLVIVIPLQGAEMTGGGYAVEISAITAAGGAAEDSGAQHAVWGAAAQPLAHGKASGGVYSMFGGVYTPAIPEAAAALACACAGVWVARRGRR